MFGAGTQAYDPQRQAQILGLAARLVDCGNDQNQAHDAGEHGAGKDHRMQSRLVDDPLARLQHSSHIVHRRRTPSIRGLVAPIDRAAVSPDLYTTIPEWPEVARGAKCRNQPRVLLFSAAR